MKLLKKREKIVDERISNTQNKLYKEAFILAMAISIVSVIVKFYLFGVGTKSVLGEILIIALPSIYFTIRSVTLGIYSDEVEMHDRMSEMPLRIKNIVIGLGLGVAIALFFGIRSSILYGDDTTRLWYFVLVFFTSLIIYCPFFAGFMAIWHFTAKKASERAAGKGQDS